MDYRRDPLQLVPVLAFLLPVNIYVIGSWVGAGIQWPVVRYQQIYGGESLLSFTTDLAYVLSGIITGLGASAILLWFLGVCLLSFAFVLIILAYGSGRPAFFRPAGVLSILSGLLFAASDMIQYGTGFHGPAGICIPVGIPFILASGVWGYRRAGVVALESALGDAGQKKKKTQSTAKTGLVSWINGKTDLVILIIFALIVRIIAFFAGNLPNLPLNVIEGAVQLYYWYATSPLLYGHIPYISYSVPYPQLFYIPIMIPLVLTAGSLNYGAYLLAFASLMLIFDTATIVLVYLIAARLFGRKNAFICGLLAATAFGAAFAVPVNFDSFPAFLLVLSLWLMECGRESAAWVAATVGTLAKWFPGVCFPFFLVHHVRSGKDRRIIIRSLIFSGAIAVLVLLPFLILDPAHFIGTFLVHIDRTPQVNTLIYFLDAICRPLIHREPFMVLSFFLIAAAEGALVLWYYRARDQGYVTLLQVIFLGLLFFVLFNKGFSSSYLIWFTPFLALFLWQSPFRVALFYLTQLIIYLETPVLFGIVYAPFNPGFSPGYEMIEHGLPSVSFLFYFAKFVQFFTIVVLMIRDIRSRNKTLAGDPL